MIFIIYLLNLLYADILGKFLHFENWLGSNQGEIANLKVKTGSFPGSFLELWGVRDLTNLWFLESIVNLGEFENVKMIQLIIVAYCSNSDHKSIDNFKCQSMLLTTAGTSTCIENTVLSPTSFLSNLRVRCWTDLKYYWA